MKIVFLIVCNLFFTGIIYGRNLLKITISDDSSLFTWGNTYQNFRMFGVQSLGEDQGLIASYLPFNLIQLLISEITPDYIASKLVLTVSIIFLQLGISYYIKISINQISYLKIFSLTAFLYSIFIWLSIRHGTEVLLMGLGPVLIGSRFFEEWLKDKKFKDIFYGTFFMNMFCHPSILIVGIIICIKILIEYIYLNSINKNIILRVIKWIVIFLLFGSYWIIPLMHTKIVAGGNFSTDDAMVLYRGVSSVLGYIENISLIHSSSEYSGFSMAYRIAVFGLFVIFLVEIREIKNNEDHFEKIKLRMAILFISFIFLSLGTNAPFEINEYISNLPFLSANRRPTKFLYGAYICIAVIMYVKIIQSKTFKIQIYILILFSLYALNIEQKIKGFEIPKEYTEVKKKIEENGAGNRLLILPEISYYNYKNGSYYKLDNIIERDNDGIFVSHANNPSYKRLFDLIYNQSDEKKEIDKLIVDLGFTHIILHKDFIRMDGTRVIEPYKWALNQLENYQLLEENNLFTIYNVVDYKNKIELNYNNTNCSSDISEYSKVFYYISSSCNINYIELLYNYNPKWVVLSLPFDKLKLYKSKPTTNYFNIFNNLENNNQFIILYQTIISQFFGIFISLIFGIYGFFKIYK